MILSKLQRLGKALMLPIAVLPIAGILLRLGQPDVLNLPFMAKAGGAIFDNLPLLFAVGISIGLAKNNDGAAGLSAVVSYFILQSGAGDVLITITKNPEAKFNMGVLTGIIAGLIAATLYNKFYAVKVPDFLGFFGGRRFVPIVTGLVSIVMSALLGFIYPNFEKIFEAVGKFIVASGALGAFIFGVANRLLIPTGLHHIVNTFVWTVFGEYKGKTGDLNRFFVKDPSAGQFMTGFFPVMMFGLLGACFAMYVTAKSKNKKLVSGMLASVAFTSFLTGITEPIEFLFMFL